MTEMQLRIILGTIIMAIIAGNACGQEKTVENRPYTDLRPFHFGVIVGTHMQDTEFNNIGPVTIANEDGTTTETLVTTDQDRWDPGFQVGVLGEWRLNTYFALRLAPTLYFGTRHITFHNHTLEQQGANEFEQRQNMKTVYVAGTVDLIYAAKRFNNHRPYVTLGMVPMWNLTSRDNDYLRLKQYDIFLSAGIGCDFYLPFFKLRPELKFMYSLVNSLDTGHASKIKDVNMLPYSMSVDKAKSKIICLTLYFE